MRVITKRDVIRSVLKRFNAQYPRPDSDYADYSWNVKAQRKALKALDLETCSEADVAATGLTGWTGLECDECNKDRDVVVRFGSEPDYEVRWQDLCPECIANGLALLK